MYEVHRESKRDCAALIDSCCSLRHASRRVQRAWEMVVAMIHQCDGIHANNTASMRGTSIEQRGKCSNLF